MPNVQNPRLTPQLRNHIQVTAQQGGLDGNKVMAVVAPESGFNPARIANNDPNHAGLIQWGRPEWAETAKAAGTPNVSWEDMQKMSTEQQLPYVYTYLKLKGITSESPVQDYYVAIAAPGLLKAPDGTVAYQKGSDQAAKNPDWDLDRDGQVTVGEIRRFGSGERRQQPVAMAGVAGGNRFAPVAGVPPLVRK